MVSRISDLYDDFGTVGLDNALWGQDTAHPLTMLNPNGMQLNDGSYVQSRQSYDMKGSRVFWRVNNIPTGGYALLNITAAPGNVINADAGVVLQYVFDSANYSPPRIIAKYSSTGLNGTFTTLGLGVPWDAVKHRFVSIRADTNGRVYWELSSDGITWINYSKYFAGTTANDGVLVPVSAASANTVNWYPAPWSSGVFNGGTVTIIGSGAQAAKTISSQVGGLITTSSNFSPTPTTASHFSLNPRSDVFFSLSGINSMKVEMVNQTGGAGTFNIAMFNTRKSISRPPILKPENFEGFLDKQAVVWGQTFGSWYTLDDNRSTRGTYGAGTDIRIDHLGTNTANKVLWMDSQGFASGIAGVINNGSNAFSGGLSQFVATGEGNDVGHRLEIDGVMYTITSVTSPSTVMITPAFAGTSTTTAQWRVPGGSTTVRTDVKLSGKVWSLKNVDIQCDLRWQSQDKGMSVEEKLYSVPRIMWRMQERIATDFPGATPNPVNNQHYELQIGEDRLTLLVWKAGVVKNLGEIYPLHMDFAKWYRFRIIHSGSTIVIYRDGGEGSPTYQRLDIEVGRFRNAELLAAGNIGFTASGSTVQWDNVRIKEGVAPPVLPEGLPVKRRMIGAYVNNNDTSLLEDPSLFYKAETDLGRQFEVVSWFYGSFQPRNPGTGAISGAAYNSEFPTAAADFASTGHSNLFAWETYGWHFADILTGMYDDLIQEVIDHCKVLPTETYIRIFSEFNGNWGPWTLASIYEQGIRDYAADEDAANTEINTNSCNVLSLGQWRATWRYIVSKFRDPVNGAKNVKFIFCANNVDIPNTNTPDVYYEQAGDSIASYVDKFSIDGYNWTERTLIQLWSSPAQTWDAQYKRFLSLDKNKPIWITETSSGEPHKYRNTFDGVTLNPVTPENSGALSFGGGFYGEGTYGVSNTTPVDSTNFAEVQGDVSYSNDYHITGQNSMKMTGPDAHVVWEFTDSYVNDGTTRHIEACNYEMYFYYPEAMDTDLVMLRKGEDVIAGVHLNTDGTLTFSGIDITGTTTSTNTYGPGKWWRIEIQTTSQDGFDFDSSGVLESDEVISNFQVRMYAGTSTAMIETNKLFITWNRSFSDFSYEGPDNIWVGADEASKVIYIDEMSATPDGWVEQQSKGAWYDELLNYRGQGNIECVCFFWIPKERQWQYWSTPETQASIKNSFSAGGDLVLDLEYYPQYKPFGVTLEAKAGHLEYLRLEEDGAVSLNILPSYGDIWLQDYDFGEAAPRESKITRAGRDGVNDNTRWLGEKAVSLSLVLLNTDEARAGYYLDLVKRWGNPARRPRVVYKFKGQSERFINVRRSNLGRPIPLTSREFINVNIQYVGYDGKDYDSLQQYGDVFAQDDDTLNVSGAVDTEPVIRIYGPCTNPVVYNDSLESEGITARVGLNMEIDEFQFVELDAKHRTVRLNGWDDDSADRRAFMSDKNWFNLNPNRTTIRLETEDTYVDGAPKGFVRVFFRNAW